MGYREDYITLTDFRHRYCSADGNFYRGYVIGLGYVYPKAGMLYPSHWRGYESGSGHISTDDTHCNGIWQYEVDSSMEAVISSLTPIRDFFRNALVQDNENGTVKVTIGPNRFVNYRKGYGTCNIDFVESNVIVNQVALQISIEIKDDKGSTQKEKYHILSKDLVVEFGTNLMSSAKNATDENNRWKDTLEFWAGIGGIGCSAGQAAGKALYSSNLAMQFSSNFELMSHSRTKVMVDNAGKIWKGASNSSLVTKTLTNKIPDASRYFPQAAPYLKWGGRACGVAGIVLSGWRFYDAYQNNHGVDMVDSGIDTIMGGVGFIPPYGWIASGGYFLLKPLVKIHAEIVVKLQMETGIVGLPSTMPFK